MEKSDALSRQLYYSTGTLNNQNIVLLYSKFFIVHAIESFALEDKKHNFLKDIHCENQGRKQEKIVSKTAREL